ncbi:MAG: MlaD family protein [Treponema sp.]|jgi:phospholipid/cholesterol/gamma-HCH transport system substrate-binding protein|nr:MlaD family protein [Treponema sp.]
MKFSIRFADQIVGALIILAMVILVFAIFMLGSNQRWFSRDYHFKTYFPTAAGLGKNMPVQYKGFTIGRVRSFELVGDQVEVRFTIFDTYIDRVKIGSLVEVLVSPISSLGGNQFIFYPGTGQELVTEGETIPAYNSAEGKEFLEQGLALRSERDDNINNLMNGAGALLSTLNTLLADMQEAFEGTDRTSLGRTMGGVEQAATGLQQMAHKLPADIEDSLNRVMVQIEPILVNLRGLSDKMASPDGSIATILDSDGDVYRNFAKSLDALSGTLQNLEKTSEFMPSQLPQLAAMIAELRGLITTMQDVGTAAKNNPLLRGGIPEQKEANTGGAHTRDMEF